VYPILKDLTAGLKMQTDRFAPTARDLTAFNVEAKSALSRLSALERA
jgi:hypothetical protein